MADFSNPTVRSWTPWLIAGIGILVLVVILVGSGLAPTGTERPDGANTVTTPEATAPVAGSAEQPAPATDTAVPPAPAAGD